MILQVVIFLIQCPCNSVKLKFRYNSCNIYDINIQLVIYELHKYFPTTVYEAKYTIHIVGSIAIDNAQLLVKAILNIDAHIC